MLSLTADEDVPSQKRYDMDKVALRGTADSKVELNSILKPGSGAGGMFAQLD